MPRYNLIPADLQTLRLRPPQTDEKRPSMPQKNASAMPVRPYVVRNLLRLFCKRSCEKHHDTLRKTIRRRCCEEHASADAESPPKFRRRPHFTEAVRSSGLRRHSFAARDLPNEKKQRKKSPHPPRPFRAGAALQLPPRPLRGPPVPVPGKNARLSPFFRARRTVSAPKIRSRLIPALYEHTFFPYI